MKVYVCECGYDYEGSTISVVFDTEEKAQKWQKFCEDLKTEWNK